MSDTNTKSRLRTDRRQFLAMATAMGVSGAWAGSPSKRSHGASKERRDLYPEGVASGDPDSNSVFLWTRRPYSTGSKAKLRVEVATDEAFGRLIATAAAHVSATSDWTARVLVGNLKPSRVYWYRFIDEEGNASRVGRTLTAPSEDDARPVKFAFVSCQNINTGALHAYRRMIYEDERAPEAERLGFVLHLGDFVYEVVWYPEDRPKGYYSRAVREVVRYANGEKVNDMHIPTTVDDYRALYRAYLRDPDLQDARARWPFVCMWDNHEFSWNGWQSVEIFNGVSRPVPTRKVAANQAWFEYQPARVVKSGGPSLEQFNPPRVVDAPITRFDEHGFGDEPNNRAAVGSLTAYRALRWGRNVELIITDQRSYRSEEPTGRAEMKAFYTPEFPELLPQEALEIVDGSRAYANGNPPETIRLGDKEIPNFRKDAPAQSLLGAEQKKWFLDKLRTSRATWKVWGSSLATLDHRVDPQNLPPGLTKPWPGAGYAGYRGADYSTAFVERAEIYEAIREGGVTGFVTVAGDRHSFWAGLAAPTLPPKAFEPVGLAFVTGSVSMSGMFEKLEYTMAKDHPLRALYVAQRGDGAPAEAAVNMLMRHGVRSCLEYQRTGDLDTARKLSNPDLAPHLSFLDLGGHGYSTVRATSQALECEFVCIPRPAVRIATPEGGPLRYRVVHRAQLWNKGQAPKLEQRVVEGEAGLSI